MIDAVRKIREKAVILKDAGDAADEILALIGDARFVLLGEASHGTHEFYQSRAEITRRLIREKDFCAVAVEADFPDAYRVNRFVCGISDEDKTALEALSNFRKYPLWMWRNTEVLRFTEWLRAHNGEQEDAQKKVGFYGLDLYSLHASMEAVLSYLNKVDPEAAQRARYRYSCFEDFAEDPQSYGYAASFDLKHSCEDEAVKQLVELQRRSAEYAGSNEGAMARDEYFSAEQNARLVRNAEEYYRQMFDRNVSSWNLRDRHMAESLSAVAAHLKKQGRTGKIVVWAHNSHLGDASATDMAARGEWNLGQLTREEYGREAVRIIGFTTFTGTVTATDNWDEPAQLKRVRPALPESCENLFHQTEIKNFFLNLRDAGDDVRETVFGKPILQRAIGVIYRPQSERVSHYFQTHLAEQFDGVIHFDETRAVMPLDSGAGWEMSEDAPETFPSGL